MRFENAISWLEKGLSTYKRVQKYRMRTSYDVSKRIFEIEEAIKVLKGARTNGTNARIPRSTKEKSA